VEESSACVSRFLAPLLFKMLRKIVEMLGFHYHLDLGCVSMARIRSLESSPGDARVEVSCKFCNVRLAEL
jgi:hypothetical protein